MTATSSPSSHPGEVIGTRLPPGYIASGDGFSRQFDAIVFNVPNKTKCNSNAVLWADSLDKIFHQAVNWLDSCRRNGITLNTDKFVFAANTVEFAGFEIINGSIRSCKKYLDAICNFQTLHNITDMRS